MKIKEEILLNYKINDLLRADKVIIANNLIKEISQKLKENGKWHPYIYQQIISYANPYKRKKLLTDFGEIIHIERKIIII